MYQATCARRGKTPILATTTIMMTPYTAAAPTQLLLRLPLVLPRPLILILLLLLLQPQQRLRLCLLLRQRHRCGCHSHCHCLCYCHCRCHHHCLCRRLCRGDGASGDGAVCKRRRSATQHHQLQQINNRTQLHSFERHKTKEHDFA